MDQLEQLRTLHDEDGRQLILMEEVASRSGVTSDAIRLAIRTGKLRARRYGRLIFIRADEIGRYTPNPKLAGPQHMEAYLNRKRRRRGRRSRSIVAK